MININYGNSGFPEKYLISNSLLRQATVYTVENFWELDARAPANYILDIDFVNNSRIKAINKKYLDRDRSTDVIAFSLEEGERLVSPNTPPLIGQVVISFDKAINQAGEMGHSIEKEILILVIHGTLHVCGWSEGKKIQECQEKIKKKILNSRE